MMEHLDAVLGAIGGALVALAPVGIAWLRRRSSTEIAATIHDERVSPILLKRVDTLEARLDERDGAIVALREEAAALREESEELRRSVDECHRDRAELQAAKVECMEVVEEMRAYIERNERDLTGRVRVAVRETLASTPPGSWQVDEDEIERLRLEEESRED